jgi:hypothetical protein
VGVTSQAIDLCEAPDEGFSEEGGDCNDDNPNVHPLVEDYFGTPYETEGGLHSFDYDCSGKEDSDPDQLGAAPACSGLSLLNCEGSGYLADDAREDIDNPLCGSTMVRVCVAQTLACAGMLIEATPHRCR